MLAKAGQGFPLSDALKLSERRKQVFHGGGAEAGEGNNAEDEKITIVETDAVLAGQGVVIAKLEEFGGVNPSPGDEAVGEEEKRDEVEGEA